MAIVTKFYTKYIKAQADSTEISDSIHRLFLEKTFSLSNFGCIVLTIIASTIVYLSMLCFPHDNYLNYWFAIGMFFYLNRILMTLAYKNGGTIFFFKRCTEISQEMLAITGFLQGILWLSLIAIVMTRDVYPLESKAMAAGFLMLYTFGSLSVYSIIPMWGTFFIPVVFVPICTFLLFQGLFWAISGVLIAIYVSVLLGVSYRNYENYFKSIYQQYENQQLAEELDKLAKTDSLTGVTNRISLDDMLDRAIKQADRAETFIAVLFLDFDRFKFINDNYGHHVGDELLKSVVCRLQTFVRQTDEIFRIGGDEFVLMLTNIESKESIDLVSNKILEVLDPPHLIEGKSIISNVSIGIAVYPDHGKTPQELIHCADTAMYKSKETGGRKFTYYDVSMDNKEKDGKKAKTTSKSRKESSSFATP